MGDRGVLLAVLAVAKGRDVVHRARAIKRHDGDDVFEDVGLEIEQHAAHARTFNLEHPGGVGPLIEFVGQLVVDGDGTDGEIGSCVARIMVTALSMTVRVLRPRKSNFTRPAASAHFWEYCDTGMSERGSL